MSDWVRYLQGVYCFSKSGMNGFPLLTFACNLARINSVGIYILRDAAEDFFIRRIHNDTQDHFI